MSLTIGHMSSPLPALLGYSAIYVAIKLSRHPSPPFFLTETETKKILSLLFLIFGCENILNEAGNIFQLQDYAKLHRPKPVQK